MGCGTSKPKTLRAPQPIPQPTPEVIEIKTRPSQKMIDTRTVTQKSWQKIDPLPSPYPQGQIELKQLIDEDYPSIVEPTPELVPIKLEGHWVRVSQTTY